MPPRRPLLARLCLFTLVSSFGLGCTLKLATMSKDEGRSGMKCKDAQWKLRFKSVNERSYIVFGCGKWQLYEGSCDGEANGCDSTLNSDNCDGSCKTELVDQGELEADGSIPEDVLHPNKKRDE